MHKFFRMGRGDGPVGMPEKYLGGGKRKTRKQKSKKSKNPKRRTRANKRK